MINLGNPDLAFKTSFLPNDGVGLARMEFIISEYIKAHPLALVHPEKVDDPQARRTIERLTRGYPDGESFFVERLSEGDRHDRRRLLAQAGRGADVGLQDQRVRQPARRRRLRAHRGATRCSASAVPRATRIPPTPRASRSSAGR